MKTIPEARIQDYQKCVEEKLKFLRENRHIVLATSYNDSVTARTIDYACSGFEILFLSWDHHVKITQIKGNPRVALCRDNIQIEGLAQILGNPFDEKNRRYNELYKEKLPILFEKFAGLPGMVFVKVTPGLFKTFFGGKDRRIEYLDICSKTAFWKELEEEEYIPVNLE